MIPNPIMDKHKYYNEVLYELFDESYDLMTHDAFIKYVIAQRETRWNFKKKLDVAKSYETRLDESGDGHWQNVRRYSTCEAKLTSKDLKPAERSVEFLTEVINDLNKSISECKTLKSNLFDKSHSVKAWKANELLFFDNVTESLSKTEAKLVKIRGDVDQNIGYLKRRVLESDAIHQDNARSKKRVKQNRRKSLKRKCQRNIKSCCAVLKKIIEPEDKAD